MKAYVRTGLSQGKNNHAEIAFPAGPADGAGMSPEAARLIARHELQPLPREGGFFRRTWTSPETAPGLGARPVSTAILFLMTPDAFSALHCLDADEIWSFQSGDPVQHLRLEPATGRAHLTILGPDGASGQEHQLVVPAGVWQAARPFPRGIKGWSLVAATMTPGWDEAGFVLGEASELGARFPAAAEVIVRFVR
jgi:predicted cupin superfamily sugar epimerase